MHGKSSSSPTLLYRLSKYAWVIAALVLMVTRAYSLPATDDVKPRVSPEERVYLLHADNLRYDKMMHPGAQRLSGKVKFRHGGMQLDCDSAVLYEASNSFEAMGHVRMTQGDTLSLFEL